MNKKKKREKEREERGGGGEKYERVQKCFSNNEHFKFVIFMSIRALHLFSLVRVYLYVILLLLLLLHFSHLYLDVFFCIILCF